MLVGDESSKPVTLFAKTLGCRMIIVLSECIGFSIAFMNHNLAGMSRICVVLIRCFVEILVQGQWTTCG